MLKIRKVEPEDYFEISVLVVSTFGQNNEHKLIETLRETDRIAIEMVATLDQRIVGHICFSRLETPENWLALAPVSITNIHQNKGYGSELIRYGLDSARRQRADAVVVVGSPHYYRRFGFVFEGPARLSSPYPSQYTGLYPIASKAASASVALRYPGAFDKV